jgi:transposase-like protein
LPATGVSVAGLALEAGVNANLLRRWIKELDVRALIPAPLASVLRGQ